jgi:hypothetical protein
LEFGDAPVYRMQVGTENSGGRDNSPALPGESPGRLSRCTNLLNRVLCGLYVPKLDLSGGNQTEGRSESQT